MLNSYTNGCFSFSLDPWYSPMDCSSVLEVLAKKKICLWIFSPFHVLTKSACWSGNSVCQPLYATHSLPISALFCAKQGLTLKKLHFWVFDWVQLVEGTRRHKQEIGDHKGKDFRVFITPHTYTLPPCLTKHRVLAMVWSSVTTTRNRQSFSIALAFT